MVIHNAVADESLQSYVKSFSKEDECTVGLILGQSTPMRDYILHFAKTPPCQTDVKENEHQPVRNITDIVEMLVADHAKHATRMLPGGVHVLGIFVASQEDYLNPFASKLKSILLETYKQLDANNFIYGNPTSTERLVLSYCSKTQTFNCKSFDMLTSSVKPVEFKFQTQPSAWKQFECKFELNQTHPIIDNDGNLSLKRHMMDILNSINKELAKAVFAFDEKIVEGDNSIEILCKKAQSKQENEDPIHVSILLPTTSKDGSKDGKIEDCDGYIKLTGQVACRIWMHPKATVNNVTSALVEDLIRSLAARLEMHWDSLIEEEHGSPEDTNSIHEPPRRVLVSLPNTEVTFSDYLFPGEGPQEAQISLQELLDISIIDKDAIKDIEGQADLGEVYHKNLDSDTDSLVATFQTDTNKFMYILGASVALLVLFISMIVHLLNTY